MTKILTMYSPVMFVLGFFVSIRTGIPTEIFDGKKVQIVLSYLALIFFFRVIAFVIFRYKEKVYLITSLLGYICLVCYKYNEGYYKDELWNDIIFDVFVFFFEIISVFLCIYKIWKEIAKEG